MSIWKKYLFLSCLVICCFRASHGQTGNEETAIPGADSSFFLELENIEPYRPYLERREGHRTQQLRAGAVGPRSLPSLPNDAKLVSYPSEGRNLKGWLLLPKESSGEPKPGVVYLHNDFSLTELSYRNALPFVEAGYPVFLPAWRGENGNPGDFELLYGEVDDARAAIRWFSQHPDVESDSIYVLGHSIGGGISALLSLYPDLPVRMSADVGGIYRARTFTWWSRSSSLRHLIQFQPTSKAEVTLRLLGPNIREMARRHISYVGNNAAVDRRYAQSLEGQARRFQVPFEVRTVSGNHMTSIKGSVEDFLRIIKAENEP